MATTDVPPTRSRAKAELLLSERHEDMPPAATYTGKGRIEITIPADEVQLTAQPVESPMGRKPDSRLVFIQENARTVQVLDL